MNPSVLASRLLYHHRRVVHHGQRVGVPILKVQILLWSIFHKGVVHDLGGYDYESHVGLGEAALVETAVVVDAHPCHPVYRIAHCVVLIENDTLQLPRTLNAELVAMLTLGA